MEDSNIPFKYFLIAIVYIWIVYTFFPKILSSFVFYGKIEIIKVLFENEIVFYIRNYTDINKSFDEMYKYLEKYISEQKKKFKITKEKIIFYTCNIIITFVDLYLLSLSFPLFRLLFNFSKIFINIFVIIILLLGLILLYPVIIYFEKEQSLLELIIQIIIEIKKIGIKSAFLIVPLLIIIPLIFIDVINPIYRPLSIIIPFLFNLLFIIFIILGSFLYYLKNYEKVNKKIPEIKEKISIYIDKIDKISEVIKDKILTLIDPNVIIPKKLIKLCLSEEKSSSFKQFVNIIDNFGRKDFKKLIEGELNIDNGFIEIEELCNRYKITDIENFKSLILKFQNFQLILSEWSMDFTKHEYLKQLWLFYPIIYKLKDLTDEELEAHLEKIQYSNWDQEAKNTFRQCINNSPEIKAIEINKIVNKIGVFMEFIENAMNYKETFKEHENMKQCEYHFYKNIKKLIRNILDKKDEVFSSSFKIKGIIENRSIDCFLNNYIKIDKVSKSYNYYFTKIVDLVKIDKVKNFINSNELLFQGINTTFSLMELCYHAISLTGCIKTLLFDCKDEVFINELEIIISNFERHKEKIKYLSQDDEKDLKLIETIILEITQDRNDIIDLIKKIKNEKEYEEYKKKQNIGKTIKNGIITIFGFSLGTAVSGGLIPIAGGIAGLTSFIKTVKSGVKTINNIKNINALTELLYQAKKKQTEIEEEIKEIKLMYIKRLSSQYPEDIRNMIEEKYS